MTRGSTTRKKGTVSPPVKINLNPLRFQTMVREVVTELYGTTSFGSPCYHLDNTSLSSLQEAAECFLEKMWKEVLDITIDSGRTTLEQRDVQTWKHRTGFKLRHKKTSLTLCELFE